MSPMKANFIQIKPWDDTIDRSVIIELFNQTVKYINPKETLLLNKALLNWWLGENTVLSRDFLRFEDNKSKIIAFLGVVKSPMLKDAWGVGYGLLPDYFKSDLPGKIIDASLSLGKKLKVPELLFDTTGLISLPFDEKLKSMGFTPIHYVWSMLLDDFRLFNIPKIPQGIILRKELEINDYSSYTTVINEAFQDSFKWEPKTEKEFKKIIDSLRKTNEIEHCFALENEKLIGTCDIFINPKQDFIGTIANFSILPSYQCRGIGSALFAFGVEFLREKGCKEITLNVEANNEKALDLYKKFGFYTQDNLTQKTYQLI